MRGKKSHEALVRKCMRLLYFNCKNNSQLPFAIFEKEEIKGGL